MNRVCSALMALSFVAACVGCSGDNVRPTVEGTVSYKGKPVVNQSLKLSRIADKPEESFARTIRIGPDGAFAGDAPEPGTYKVTIEPPRSAQEGKTPTDLATIPEKYRGTTTTDLIWTIERGPNRRDFALSD